MQFATIEKCAISGHIQKYKHRGEAALRKNEQKMANYHMPYLKSSSAVDNTTFTEIIYMLQ